MKALIFDIILNSLYSIRIPYTWQSALTYPILPPSAVIGMLANALQRYKNNKHPMYYLEIIEDNIIWAGSRLLTPCIIKSYITSAIVKWEDKIGGKFTNALGRQFAYAKELQIASIFKDRGLLDCVHSAIKTTPLTCGDSESPITVRNIKVRNVSENMNEGIIQTNFLFPFSEDTKILEGVGEIFLMHERCIKSGNDKSFPLTSYIVPLYKENNILKPSYLKISKTNEKVYLIDGLDGYIIV